MGSVSARVVGAGFSFVVGSYLCDTQACAPSCPREQPPWSDGNNHLLCARLWTEAAEAGCWGGRQQGPDTQDALFFMQSLSWRYCHHLLHCPILLGHFGPVLGGLAIAMEP
jgi:hypothetical protein